MKKNMLWAAAALLLLCGACNKEKNCRCSVIGFQDVRVITIKSGSCDRIQYVQYRDALDTLHTQQVLCTDYAFKADSNIVVNQ